MTRILPLALLALTAIVPPAVAQEVAPAPRPVGGVPAVSADGAVPAAPAPVVAAPLTHDLAGPYLAGRQAAVINDFPAAAAYFLRALAQDPGEPFLIDSALVSLISAGQVDRAVALSRDLAAQNDATELADLTLRAAAAKAGDWTGLLAMLDSAPKTSADPNAQGGVLLDGMMRAWAELGAGRASDAMAQLEGLARIRGARDMVNYNLALVKASVGD